MFQKVRPIELGEKTRQLLRSVKHGRPDGETMAALTRRRFLTAASPAGLMGAGLGLLATAGATRNLQAQSSDAGTITSNFNGTAIPGGDWIWFTSVLKVHGLDSAPVTIGFTGSIQFTANGTLYFLPVPSALVTFSPSVTLATTVFCNGQWVTMVPLSGLAGNVFLDGYALQAPSPAGFPGGIQPVTWQGIFVSLSPGISVQWQWAAAVYSNAFFGADYTQLGVKPVDDNKASIYQNSDHAGTPETFKPYVVGGARGGGGSNFTGSYSGTGAVTPAPANMMSGCSGGIVG